MSRSSQATLSGYKIRVIRPSASPIDHDLEEGRSIFIGRGDSCGIQIKGDGIADIHCLLEVEDGVVSIQDWASNSGTQVNGNPIEDKTTLEVGDSIAIGSIKVELAGSPSAKKKVADNLSSAPPREESIGMEHLGVKEEMPETTPAVESKPDLTPTTGRLSDALTAEHPQQDHEDAIGDSFAAEGSDALAEEAVFEANADDFDSEDESTPALEELEVKTECETDERLDTGIEATGFSDDDLDWDPNAFEEEQVDPEIVSLLKSEIEDLRIQLAERDEQLAAMEGMQAGTDETQTAASASIIDADFGSGDLVGRVDELLAELADHDERVSTLQELLQTAEVQNQAEREERNCLENWVGEIEQRIGERESEWQAEQDSLRDRLEDANQQRDQLQQQLHAAAKRFGKATSGEIVPDETLAQLQKQNGELQSALEESQKQCAALTRQVERLQTEEPEDLQELRAELAKEKASVSRMRFQLSKQLQEFGETPQPKDQPDREFALKLQTLREHLREIHEEEKCEREQRGDSLFGRISGLWKRVDDKF